MDELRILDKNLWDIVYKNDFLTKLFNAICFLTSGEDHTILIARYITSRFAEPLLLDSGERFCVICQDNSSSDSWVHLHKCKHAFHSKCFSQLAQMKRRPVQCPLCRDSCFETIEN